MSWHDSAHWQAENAARVDVCRNGEWIQSGACRGLHATPVIDDVGPVPHTFFPERGEDERPAKSICKTCPVKSQCLGYALDAGEKFGIWGGTSERQRRTMRRNRRNGNEPATVLVPAFQLVLFTWPPTVISITTKSRTNVRPIGFCEQLTFAIAA